MHPRIGAAALKQDVMAVLCPSCCKSSVHNRSSVAASPKFGVSDDILEEPVPPPSPQQIWRSDKHATRNDPAVRAGYENTEILFMREYLRPDLFGFLFWLRAGTHFRDAIRERPYSERFEPSIMTTGA